MKTGREWLAMLPKDAQFRWMKEMIRNDAKHMARYFLDRDFQSMAEFILSTFLWEKSNDGVTYWGNHAFNEQYL